MASFSQKQITQIHRSIAAHHKKREALDAAATEVAAIKVTYDTPAPDGTFEILFMRGAQADNYTTNSGKFEKISFEDGVKLAALPDCCGGQHALKEARRFQQINPHVQKLYPAPI